MSRPASSPRAPFAVLPPLLSPARSEDARAEARRLLNHADRATRWENEFLASVTAARGQLTLRQAAKLTEVRHRIEARIARAWAQ